MSVLLDTNILTRLAQPTHPHHAPARQAVAALSAAGEALQIVPQNVYEFWAVATRPVSAANGLGLTTAQAKSEVARIRSLFSLLPDGPAVFAEWERLVVTYDVKGKPAHDARLVAAMAVHGITRILTFNESDFARYAGISTINPLKVVPPPPRP